MAALFMALPFKIAPSEKWLWKIPPSPLERDVKGVVMVLTKFTKESRLFWAARRGRR